MRFSPYDHLIPPFATFASGLTLHDLGYGTEPGAGREGYARMIVSRTVADSLGTKLFDLNTLSPDVAGKAIVISCSRVSDDTVSLLMRLCGPVNWVNAVPPWPQHAIKTPPDIGSKRCRIS